MSLFAISRHYQPQVLEAISAAVEAARVAADEAAQSAFQQSATDFSILTLSQDVAGQLDAPVDEVFHCLCNAPVNLHGMLAEPEGWVVLANYVARSFGAAPWQYRPQVH